MARITHIHDTGKAQAASTEQSTQVDATPIEPRVRRKRGEGTTNLTGNKRTYSPMAAAAAITECKGLISDAAKMLGIHARTLRSYVYKYPLVSEALKEARQRTGDLCELRLFEAIDRGESWAIKLYATTQMRDRGYGDKPYTGEAATPIKVEQPKSLQIDYDAYNKAYEEAMDVLRSGPQSSTD